ncbi:cytochrome c biogenesis protein CcsA [Fodinicurvata sediminis]|uniref:cytochrome c biogenesis protein CcsA n=1 Tax=Fodinicurvata sediminis TaxID=1121832 RepID=UPI00047C54B5|nr:cytochrome c biogenesis protein CcsA [Fodinicurvata sediminis]
MSNLSLISSVAVLSLLPVTLLSWRRGQQENSLLFLVLLLAAFSAVTCYLILRVSDGWDSGFSFTLWVSVASSLLVYLLLCICRREAEQLAVLLLPYLLGLALLALLIDQVSTASAYSANLESWLLVHIIGALGAYAFATLAAVSALAVFLQERGLKKKQAGTLSGRLPALAEAEWLERRLLVVGEVVLGLSILSGMALQYIHGGYLLDSNHKTLFSLAAFALIAIVIYLQWYAGLRGRRAGRWVLLGYLLLSLAYPGVKFVTGVLLV